MINEMLGVFVITTLALILRGIEDAKKLHRDNQKREFHLPALYECLNVHLTLSLGMLGLAWSASLSGHIVSVCIVFILLGVASKALISTHQPENLRLGDFDALWGLWVPNGFGFATMIFVSIYLIVIPLTSGNESRNPNNETKPTLKMNTAGT